MEDKIISGGNEIIFDRHSHLVDIIEQIDPFFDYHLVVINGATVDRIDRITVDRNTLKLKEKNKSKNQWIFLGNDGIEYTVFSSESSDFLANPGLSDLILARQIIDDSDSDESTTDDAKKSDDGKGDGIIVEKHQHAPKNDDNESSSDKNSDILTEGWSENGSSSELYRKKNIPIPDTIETDNNLVFKLNTEETII